jgi:son of sevenless-like protein
MSCNDEWDQLLFFFFDALIHEYFFVCSIVFLWRLGTGAERTQNSVCCECRAPGTTYISCQLGIFLCEECATLHAEVLGKNISQVKNIDLGTASLWDPQVLVNLRNIGNRLNRAHWEAELPSTMEPPSPGWSRSRRADWLRAKYLQRLFVTSRSGFLLVRRNREKERRLWCTGVAQGLAMMPAPNQPACEVIEASIWKIEYEETSPEFRLTTPTAKYCMRAASPDEARDWVESLRALHVRIQHKAQATRPAPPSPSATPRGGDSPAQPHGRLGAEGGGEQEAAPANLRDLLDAWKARMREESEERARLRLELQEAEREERAALEERDQAAARLVAAESALQAAQERAAQARLRLELCIASCLLPDPPVAMSAPPQSQEQQTQPDAAAAVEEGAQQEIRREGQLVAASVPRLVQLCTASTPDAELQTTFFLTYRTFTTPERVLELLLARFDHPGEGEVRRVVQLRVLHALRHWLQHQWHDFAASPSLLEELVNFLEEAPARVPELVAPLDLLTQQLRRRLMLGEAATEAKAPQPTSSPPPPPPLWTASSGRPGELPRLEEVEPLEIARQLTLLEADLFARIAPREFLQNLAWSPQRAAQLGSREAVAPRLMALVRHTNQTTQWMALFLLRESSARTRAERLGWLVRLGVAGRELENFNMVMEVVSALHQQSVARLRRTWELLDPRLRAHWEELAQLMSPLRSHAAYRAALRAAAPPGPCVPSMPVFLTDLVMIEESQPSTVDGLVNFAKRRKFAEALREVQALQQVPYALRPVPELQELLRALEIEAMRYPPARLEELSLALEPPSDPLPPPVPTFPDPLPTAPAITSSRLHRNSPSDLRHRAS